MSTLDTPDTDLKAAVLADIERAKSESLHSADPLLLRFLECRTLQHASDQFSGALNAREYGARGLGFNHDQPLPTPTGVFFPF
jgi:hypothetical protein